MTNPARTLAPPVPLSPEHAASQVTAPLVLPRETVEAARALAAAGNFAAQRAALQGRSIVAAAPVVAPVPPVAEHSAVDPQSAERARDSAEARVAASAHAADQAQGGDVVPTPSATDLATAAARAAAAGAGAAAGAQAGAPAGPLGLLLGAITGAVVGALTGDGASAAAQPGTAPPDVAPVAPVTAATDAEGAVLDATTDGAATAETPVVAGAPSTIDQWRAQADQAIAAIPQPTAGDYSPAESAIRARGFRAAAARGEAARAGARPALRPPARIGAPHAPVEPDPVPEQTRAVVAASNRLLPDQAPPPLRETPNHTMPQLGRVAVPETTFHIILVGVPPDVTGVSATTRAGVEAELAPLREALLAPSPAAAAPGTAPALPPVRDAGPLSFEPLPEAVRADVTQVIARVLADPAAAARGVLTTIRQRVPPFTDGLLHDTYPTLGESVHVPALQSALVMEVNGIAEQMGVTNEQLTEQINRRRAALGLEQLQAAVDIHAAARGATTAVAQSAQAEVNAAAGVERAVGAQADGIRRAARAVPLPMDVPHRQTRLLAANTQDVAAQVAQYRRAGERRASDLDGMGRLEIAAYHYAAQQDHLRIVTEAGEERNSTAVQMRAQASERWATEQEPIVRADIEALKRAAATIVTGYIADVRAAGDAKRDAIRAWADQQTGHVRTEQERVADQASDAAAQREADAAAWTAQRFQAATLQMAADVALVRRIEEAVHANRTEQQIIADEHLVGEQVAIVHAFFATDAGTGEERALGAVMAGVKGRLADAQQDPVGRGLPALAATEHPDDWENLERLGAVESPGFVADEVASNVRAAVNRIGTNTQAIWDNLRNRTPIQLAAIRSVYHEHFGVTIDEDLEGDLSGRELERAQALMRGNQIEADVIEMRRAMRGNQEGHWWALGITGLGTDDAALMTMMRGRSEDERRQMDEAYSRLFGTAEEPASLLADAQSELEEANARRRFEALHSGNTALADALALRDALPVHEEANHPWYVNMPDRRADRDAVRGVFASIRRDVEAEGARHSWTSAAIEAEIYRRNQEVAATFQTEFGRDYDVPGAPPATDALESAFTIGTSASEGDRNLFRGLLANDRARVEASTVRQEDEGVYADDNVINTTLGSSYDRAIEELRRDEMPVRRLLINRQLAADEAAYVAAHHERWSGEQLLQNRRRLERQTERQLETLAQPRAQRNMADVRAAYQRDFHQDFDTVVRSDTQLFSDSEAEWRLYQGGYLRPAQRVFYGVYGPGTNQAYIDSALEGRTADEIRDMADDYRTFSGHDADMFSDLRWDYLGGGRDLHRLNQQLRGVPETTQDQIDRLQEDADYERQVGWVSRQLGLGQAETRWMDSRLARLRTDHEQLQRRDLSDTARSRLLGDFERDTRTVEVAIEAHHAEMESLTEKVTTVVGLAVAVIVGIVVTAAAEFFSAGTATPAVVAFWAAVIGSVAGTAATMATKQLLLGQQYSWGEVGTDVIVGAVDLAVAMLTAGIGNRLGGAQAARGAVTGAAGRAGARRLSWATIRRLAAREIGHGIEATLIAVPTAFTGAILNEDTWASTNAWERIGEATVHGAAMSGAMAMGMRVVQAPTSALSERVRGYVRSRAPEAVVLREAWGAFRRENPHASYEDFVWALETARRQSPELRERVPDEHVPQNPAELERAVAGHPPEHVAGERVPIDQPPEHVPAERLPPERLPERTGAEPLPRELTPEDLAAAAAHEERLRAGLPEQLRTLPLEVDPRLEGNTVEVRFDRRRGIIGNVRIVAGPHARPIDVLLHLPTMHALRRYSGLSGRVAQLGDRVRGWIGRYGHPPFGTRAWVARLEIEKLPLIIEHNMQQLRRGDLDAHQRQAVLDDIAHLSRQIEGHHATLDRMDLSPGEGFVAAAGRAPEPPVTASRQYARGDPNVPNAPRREAANSPLSSRLGPGERVSEVGTRWLEDGRMYRLVEVVDAQGRITRVREEIRLQDARGRNTDEWVQRGSESAGRGGRAEVGSVLQSAAQAQAATGHVDRPLPVAQIQRSGGQGFDQVIIRFENGEARFVIVEVKDYPNRYVPLEDFTAINQNLRRNLRDLRTALNDPNAGANLGLNPTELAQARAAINQRRPNLTVELRMTPDTLLGTSKTGTVMNDLATSISAQVGRKVPVIRNDIAPSYMAQAEQVVSQRDRIGSRPRAYELATVGGTISAPTLREAGTALVAERGSAVQGPLRRGNPPTIFVDGANNRFSVVAEPVRSPADVRSVGDAVLERLRSPIPTGQKPMNVLLDVTHMPAAQQTALRNYLVANAKGQNASAMLGRVTAVNERTLSTQPFVP